MASLTRSAPKAGGAGTSVDVNDVELAPANRGQENDVCPWSGVIEVHLQITIRACTQLSAPWLIELWYYSPGRSDQWSARLHQRVDPKLLVRLWRRLLLLTSEPAKTISRRKKKDGIKRIPQSPLDLIDA